MKNHSLNSAQAEAVNAPDGPLLILAGAGSGKTRVLVQRVVHFVQERGIPPENLLAVTFTNKAASEMRLRLSEELGGASRGLWVGTFHSIAHRLLRTHWQEAGLSEHFQILDSEDQLRLIKRLIQSLKWDEDLFEPKQVASFINRQKDEGKRAGQQGPFYSTEGAQLAELYQHYEQQCIRQGLVDFAEILLAADELWKKNPALLAHYQDKFYIVLVDEFQDTNTIQYSWLKSLAGSRANLTVVGDDDQSIYGWRGAKIENIQRFSRDFVGANIIRLEQNYRSTDTILKAANALISQNQGRLGKSLWTQSAHGEAIGLYAAFNEMDEALFIVRKIESLTDSLDNVAILYRSHAQSRILEQVLRRHQIAYKVYGGLRFFDRAEIKDALAYLRLIANVKDDLAFDRVINLPTRGIGDKTLENLRQIARSQQLSYFEALEIYVEELPPRRQQSIRSFIQMIHELRIASERLPLALLLEQALKQSRLWQLLQESKDEKAQAKLENLQELITASEEFASSLSVNPKEVLQAFLSEIVLDPGDRETEGLAAVKLMTLHSAKGLEFDHVFLSGLEEGLFPHHRTLQSAKELEEERRLCYVGITRARKTLHLSFARSRAFAGRTGDSRPSRFISEIPKELLKSMNSQSQSQPFTPIGRMMASIDESFGFKLGQVVQHPRFGKGSVLAAEGEGEMARIQVRFQEGTKWLVLAYAKLEPA
jgi:DNA helicase-2/ATP-dependent DNA helicase PcrA